MSSRAKSKERTAAGGAAAGASSVAVKSPPGIEVEASEQTRDPVPGKISEKEWKELIAVDDGIETVYEIIEEIVDTAMHIIWNKYVANEIYPYAVEDAKTTILNVIALQFVARDEGEKDTDTDPTWLPDEPPIPAPIDSWACGMIPMARAESLHSLVEALEPIKIHKPECAETLENTTTTMSTTVRTTTESMTSISKASLNRYRRRKSQASRSTISKSSRQRVVITPLENPLEEEEEEEGPFEVTPSSSDEKQTTLARQSTSVRTDKVDPSMWVSTPQDSDRALKPYVPFGLTPVQVSLMKDIQYDKHGNIVSILKLNPKKFPSRSIRPTVNIIHPAKETSKKFKSPKLQQKAATFKPPLGKITKGGMSSFNETLLSPKKPKKRSAMDGAREEAREVLGGGVARKATPGRTTTVMPSDAGLTKKISSRRFPSTPALPSLVDTIDPLPGVSVREGGRSVHGPTPTFRPPVSPATPLRPVKPLEVGQGGGANRSKDKQYRPTAVV